MSFGQCLCHVHVHVLLCACEYVCKFNVPFQLNVHISTPLLRESGKRIKSTGENSLPIFFWITVAILGQILWHSMFFYFSSRISLCVCVFLSAMMDFNSKNKLRNCTFNLCNCNESNDCKAYCISCGMTRHVMPRHDTLLL